MLTDLASIFTVTVLLLGLVLAGHLSLELAMLAAFALVVLRAFGRRQGRLTSVAFTIVLPVVSLIVLVNTYGSTSAERTGLSGAILLLVIVLFSFFLILGGGVRKRS